MALGSLFEVLVSHDLRVTETLSQSSKIPDIEDYGREQDGCRSPVSTSVLEAASRVLLHARHTFFLGSVVARDIICKISSVEPSHLFQ